MHQELGFYTQAGMSNYEALRTATVNPAKVYDAFSTIENGKYANFMLSPGNPLENLATLQNPHWVMVNGRLIRQPMLKTFKEKAYNRHNYLASMVRVFKYILWDK
ncbi:amidohydrolase family protein [Pontibacter oryzae]|uniref:amidohydrolase family protein n=1 Tax=Pontibacter oryzae TaxID=2304593 RepID=UPI001F448DBC|nr:amidohydrolase family protein [Pontibacter oryzae]